MKIQELLKKLGKDWKTPDIDKLTEDELRSLIMDEENNPLKASDSEKDLAAIKKAYQKKALKTHPDKNPNNITEATANFALLNAVYNALKDKIEKGAQEEGPRHQDKKQYTEEKRRQEEEERRRQERKEEELKREEERRRQKRQEEERRREEERKAAEQERQRQEAEEREREERQRQERENAERQRQEAEARERQERENEERQRLEAEERERAEESKRRQEAIRIQEEAREKRRQKEIERQKDPVNKLGEILRNLRKRRHDANPYSAEPNLNDTQKNEIQDAIRRLRVSPNSLRNRAADPAKDFSFGEMREIAQDVLRQFNALLLIQKIKAEIVNHDQYGPGLNFGKRGEEKDDLGQILGDIFGKEFNPQQRVHPRVIIINSSDGEFISPLFKERAMRGASSVDKIIFSRVFDKESDLFEILSGEQARVQNRNNNRGNQDEGR